MTETQESVAKHPVVLEMRTITKEFPGVKALDQVTIKVRAGEIHSICGENGAGKSTLMKVLSGVYPYGSYQGDIFFQDEEQRFANIKASEAAGIVIIHQELALIPELSVTENIFLGNEVKNRFGAIDWSEAHAKAAEWTARVGLEVDPTTPIKELGVGHQQLVEIARALAKDVKLLVLDEPTSALNEEDSAHLLDLMRSLKSRGITCIMISHKLNEVAAISDGITIIRDGQTVEAYDTIPGQVDEDRIIRGMVGRSLDNRYPEHTPEIGEVMFEVRNWRVESPVIPGRIICKDSSFNVRKGEIVGFAGLMGAGRTELARSIFGHNYGQYLGGEAYLHGKKLDLHTVSSAIGSGLAYVPEDRKVLGLNLLDDIKRTITSADPKRISRNRTIDPDLEYIAAEEYRKSLRIKAPTVNEGVGKLSGGNQQKVVLAKWMFTQPEVLILDEPTRGIDVGAKYEIYTLIQRMADAGKSVIVISSELPELLGITDRIYTIFEGAITGEIASKDADQETLLRLMTGTAPATSR